MVRTTTLAVAASLFFARGSLADDGTAPPAPPPVAEKHVNKVSDAAKAAFEKMGKISNNPVGRD
jgi:hypothetical protein